MKKSCGITLYFTLAFVCLFSTSLLLGYTANYGLLCVTIILIPAAIIAAFGYSLSLLALFGSTRVACAAIAKSRNDEASKTLINGEERQVQVKTWFEKKSFCTALSFFLLFISIICIAAVVALRFVLVGPPPSLSGTFSSPLLSNGATIEFEENGLFHIKADNFYDLGFAQGVGTAKLRLFQLDIQRRLVSGTMSEVLGSAALKSDKLMRTLAFLPLSRTNLPYIGEDAMQMLTGLIDGVNAYVNATPTSQLPVEFRLLGYRPAPFEPADMVAWGKYMSYSLSENLDYEARRWNLQKDGITCEEIQELIPPYTTAFGWPTVLTQDMIAQTFPDLPVQTPQYPVDPKEERDGCFPQYTRRKTSAEQMKMADVNKEKQDDSYSAFRDILDSVDMMKAAVYGSADKSPRWLDDLYSPLSQQLKNGIEASNNWVVGSKSTRSGKPLLANDPHLPMTAPSIWMIMHAECDACGVNAIGATFIGTPGVIIGRNSKIAWGVTNAMPDVQDLYVMQPGFTPNTYVYNGSEVAYGVEEIVIKVRGESNVTMERLTTVYGPVVSDVMNLKGDDKLALQWTTLMPGKDVVFEAFFEINRASNWEEYTSALSTYVSPSQNFIFADVDGNIGYYMPGKVPIRPAGHVGSYPVPGNGSYNWLGFIPFEQLPHVFNPDRDYVVSANNKVSPQNYNYSLNSDWGDGFRAERITEMVEAQLGNHTVESFIDIQLDRHTLLFTSMKPYFSRMNPSERAKPWVEKLQNWDGNVGEPSEIASFFEIWYQDFTRLTSNYTHSGQLTSWSFVGQLFLEVLNNTRDDLCQTWVGKGCYAYANECFDTALDRLSPSSTSASTSPSSLPKWGEDIHTVAFDNQVLGKTPFGCVSDRSYYEGGDGATVNVAHFGNDLVTTFGPSYRQIIDLNDMENSIFIYPMGQSGDIFSELYDNLLPLYRGGKYIPMKTTGYDVSSTITLVKEVH
mmetsp:Transcript_20549/g.52793  ORF Transcript_20549/g.52793 Transcript_20549/m.52793 type:complete len:961 (-) Transcript_20549:499-3381(-)